MCLAALAYAVSFGTLEPADFTFVNGTEIESIDPAIVTGVPEHRIITALFEGLLREHPKTLEPIPGVAERYELSEDHKTYTFYLREGCKWSDGSPVTAHDFHWSWLRFLHPETAAQYVYQLYYAKNARKYNTSEVAIGDRVEVERDDRPEHPSGQQQLFPRGTIVRGKLLSIEKPAEPSLAADASDEEKSLAQAQWKRGWVYEVEIEGQSQRFAKEAVVGAETCRHVLLDFSEVGIKVLDDHTLEVTLEHSTPYFLHLMAFYPMFPVNKACVEKYGVPAWSKPENIVSNGAYLLKSRRIRDRIRMVKNPIYWNAENVQIETIDALAIDSLTTALNMYVTGQVDWIIKFPNKLIPFFEGREDFSSAPMFTTYFYRINVTRSPGDNKLVRQALNLAINKREICAAITRGGEVPARSLVPPIAGYKAPLCDDYDVAKAQSLLAQAGYPGGRGLPIVEIMFNTQESHRTIAEKIQSDWKKNLGIDVELKQQEWGVYLAAVRSLDYWVARAGWIADYNDPNTFLDMFVTDGENNQTGWGNERYDELIARAAQQVDLVERAKTLAGAEAILMDELPIIPIYFYVSSNLVRPYVKNFHANAQDLHPLPTLRVDPREKAEYLKAEGLR